MEIDENEEYERLALLNQRETLLRGLGKFFEMLFLLTFSIFSTKQELWICVIEFYLVHQVPQQVFRRRITIQADNIIIW